MQPPRLLNKETEAGRGCHVAGQTQALSLACGPRIMSCRAAQYKPRPPAHLGALGKPTHPLMTYDRSCPAFSHSVTGDPGAWASTSPPSQCSNGWVSSGGSRRPLAITPSVLSPVDTSECTSPEKPTHLRRTCPGPGLERRVQHEAGLY